MSNEFQPYYPEENANEFNAWEYQATPDKEKPVVNVEEDQNKEFEVLRQEAIAQGYAEGLQKAQKEIDEKKEALAQWLLLIQKPILFLDEQLTDEVLKTLMWLCQHCIGVELSINPEKLHHLFAAIKEELPALKTNKILAMHPDDVAWIKSELSDEELPGLQEVIVADATLHRGDFYLKSDDSELDGRLQTRLNTLFAKYI